MATKITNSVLFRACKWLTENGAVTSEELDKMTSREIVNMYELHSATYTVEYDTFAGTFRWRGCTYGQAVSRVACVIDLNHRPEVWRESDRECVTRQFDVPVWL